MFKILEDINDDNETGKIFEILQINTEPETYNVFKIIQTFFTIIIFKIL